MSKEIVLFKFSKVHEFRKILHEIEKFLHEYCAKVMPSRNPSVYRGFRRHSGENKWCEKCLQRDWYYSVGGCHHGFYHTQKKSLGAVEQLSELNLVGVPGLEPGKAGPESAVLPLHHTPICF